MMFTIRDRLGGTYTDLVAIDENGKTVLRSHLPHHPINRSASWPGWNSSRDD